MRVALEFLDDDLGHVLGEGGGLLVRVVATRRAQTLTVAAT